MSQTGHSQGSLSGEILLPRKKGKHKRGLISFQIISQVRDQKWIMSFGFSSKDVHVKILLIFNNSSTQSSLKISSKHRQVLNAGEAIIMTLLQGTVSSSVLPTSHQNLIWKIQWGHPEFLALGEPYITTKFLFLFFL